MISPTTTSTLTVLTAMQTSRNTLPPFPLDELALPKRIKHDDAIDTPVEIVHAYIVVSTDLHITSCVANHTGVVEVTVGITMTTEDAASCLPKADSNVLRRILNVCMILTSP